MTKAEIAETMETIWDLLLEGNTDKEIIELTGLEADAYKQLRQRLVEEKAAELTAKPAEHVYVEYVIWQSQGIVDLTKMMDQFRKTKQYNAMVGAVRVRAELYDKLIAKGQEFGVFKKTPERREILGGFVLADLSSDKLRTMVTGALSDLDKLMKRYGEADIIDIGGGPTHYGPRLIEASGEAVEVPEAPPAKDDPVPEPKGSKVFAAPPSIVAPPKPTGKSAKKAKARTSRQSSKARGRRPDSAIGANKRVTPVEPELSPDVWDD
jgi:hypothetical protein